MYGGRIGQYYLIKLGHVIHHLATIEADRDFPLLQVYPQDLPDVAVETILLIIIDGLDDLIPCRMRPAKPGDTRGRLGI